MISKCVNLWLKERKLLQLEKVPILSLEAWSVTSQSWKYLEEYYAGGKEVFPRFPSGKWNPEFSKARYFMTLDVANKPLF